MVQGSRSCLSNKSNNSPKRFIIALCKKLLVHLFTYFCYAYPIPLPSFSRSVGVGSCLSGGKFSSIHEKMTSDPFQVTATK